MAPCYWEVQLIVQVLMFFIQQDEAVHTFGDYECQEYDRKSIKTSSAMPYFRNTSYRVSAEYLQHPHKCLALFCTPPDGCPDHFFIRHLRPEHIVGQDPPLVPGTYCLPKMEYIRPFVSADNVLKLEYTFSFIVRGCVNTKVTTTTTASTTAPTTTTTASTTAPTTTTTASTIAPTTTTTDATTTTTDATTSRPDNLRSALFVLELPNCTTPAKPSLVRKVDGIRSCMECGRACVSEVSCSSFTFVEDGCRLFSRCYKGEGHWSKM